MARGTDTAAAVVEHEAAWLRTAYLLTGDPAAAEELLGDALAAAYRRRRDDGGLERAVRRAVVRGSLRRRSPGRARAAAGPAPTGVAEELRRALLALPPLTRAALVLQLHDDLPAAEAADALGCSPGTVTRLTADGAAALRTALPGRPGPAAPPPGAPAPPAAPAADRSDDIYRRPA